MQIKKREFGDYVKYGYYQGRFFIKHREDGPAIEWSDGTKSWFIHGKQHRENGPVVEFADGTKFWWIHGKRHREDGPAVDRVDGSKIWFLENEKIEEEDFEEAVKIYKLSKVCK
jgi:hypothetical protein